MAGTAMPSLFMLCWTQYGGTACAPRGTRRSTTLKILGYWGKNCGGCEGPDDDEPDDWTPGVDVATLDEKVLVPN